MGIRFPNVLKWIVKPLDAIFNVLLMTIVAMIVLLCIGGYVFENITGIHVLPPLLAPERPIPQKKLEQAEIDCTMYNALIDMKGAKSKSRALERNVVKTILAYGRINDVSQCNVMYTAATLVPVGAIHPGTHRDMKWLWGEFSDWGEEKLALQVLIKELVDHPDYDWHATNYIRPDRTDLVGSMGNQTQKEKDALRAQMDLVPTNDPAQAEFEFFKPRPKPKPK